MKPPIAFLVPPTPGLDHVALGDLCDSIRASTGLVLAPARVPFAALLPQALDAHAGALGWAPSIVAAELVHQGLATPVASIKLRDRLPHSAVLVARPGVDSLADLAGRSIAWVSKLSATGYLVPRLYLETFGVDVAALVGSQTYCGSHDAAALAFARGRVDVVATHSGRVRPILERCPARLLASIGPIPSDLVVAGPRVPAGVREALAHGLRSLDAGCFRLGAVRPAHLDLVDRLRSLALDHRSDARSTRKVASRFAPSTRT